VLSARILEGQRAVQDKEQAETRKSLVGTGDRSDRIRTYNFPQGRVTDHRINLTLYKLDDFIMGSIDQIIDPLINEYQAEQLAELAEENT
jgi:peptide chain release factor 1